MKKSLEDRKVEALEEIAKTLKSKDFILPKKEDSNVDEWGYPRKYEW